MDSTLSLDFASNAGQVKKGGGLSGREQGVVGSRANWMGCAYLDGPTTAALQSILPSENKDPGRLDLALFRRNKRSELLCEIS